MAYFDSVKNRVLWQKELDRMKQERDRQEREGSATEKSTEGVGKENPFCVRMTFEQLEQEVHQDKQISRGVEHEGRKLNREMKKTVQKEKSL